MTFQWPNTAVELVIIVALAVAVRALLVRVINKSMRRLVKRAEAKSNLLLSEHGARALMESDSLAETRQVQRTRTLENLLRSTVNFLIIILATLMILQTLKINIGPILASAGIGGVAIGFGAQSLVKDLISGFFLIAEDQYGVGDYVTVKDISGTVVNFGLRVTRIQDASGQIWYIRNGEIATLGNRTQGWSSSTVDFPISLKEDPRPVMQVLQDTVDEVDEDPRWSAVLLDKPAVLGMSSIDDHSAIYSILVKCVGNQQWELERELRKVVLERLVQAGISTPVTYLQTQ